MLEVGRGANDVSSLDFRAPRATAYQALALCLDGCLRCLLHLAADDEEHRDPWCRCPLTLRRIVAVLTVCDAVEDALQ